MIRETFDLIAVDEVAIRREKGHIPNSATYILAMVQTLPPTPNSGAATVNSASSPHGQGTAHIETSQVVSMVPTRRFFTIKNTAQMAPLWL